MKRYIERDLEGSQGWSFWDIELGCANHLAHFCSPSCRPSPVQLSGSPLGACISTVDGCMDNHAEM